jgi:regulator of replication initiation timing
MSCVVERDEQLARRVVQLEQAIRELVEENIELRTAASDFGALAERLNNQLIAERRASSWSSKMTLWITLDRFAAQMARYRVRT